MKKRVDIYLPEKGLAPSREKARVLVMAGLVSINGIKCAKPSCIVPEGAVVSVKQSNEFASRGGRKLQKALDAFNLDIKGKTAIDIGASAGGFTDCMLKNGVEYVYAVDVGYGQLSWNLRQDKRVCVMERQNARFLTRDMFDRPINFSCIDVSFISLKLILPAAAEILSPPFTIVALIKPQFEAGRGSIGKRGVVRDKQAHIEVIESVLEFSRNKGLCIRGVDFSPIKGPKGNIEYLVCLNDCGDNIKPDINRIVDTAHEMSV